MSETALRKSILVVDDAPENIRILKHILDSEYRVLAATSGSSALRLAFGDNPPDLILLDVMMPDMDGYQVCRQLKANLQTHDIPVIFATARSEATDEAHGFSLGAADYITKPVSAPVVLARIATHLALYDRNKHLEKLVNEQTEHLQRQASELQETQLEIVRSLGRAAEYRDNETGMHVIRMGHYSRLLAERCGYSPAESEQIMHASIMHDIGKIGIPDQILLKPGKLTNAEFDIIRQHPEIGASIIGERRLELLQLSRSIALTHHERWNGTGYPQGLRGEQIPLHGRITAIADVFDALTSERPYKQAWSLEDALEEIQREAGIGLDAELVDMFLELRPHIEHIMLCFPDTAE